MAKKSSSNLESPQLIADPKTPEDYTLRGWGHYTKKEFYRAEADFRKALELSPNNPEFLYNLAMSLGASGRPQEAVQVFEQALQGLNSPPEDMRVRYLMLARFAHGHINRIKTGDWHMQ